jgi:SpoVK/Ycf46/Vps4 family AAA+-type ATPase
MDFERLASQTEGYTGADIANICREAKMGALEADLSSLKEKRITTDDMLEIIHAIKPSAPSNTMGSYMSFISLYGGR